MTNDFNLDQVLDSQTLKETTINTAIGQLAEGLGNTLSIDATAGNVTVSDANYRRNVYFKRTDTTAARSVTVKAFRRFFLYENSAVSTNLVLGSTTIAVASGELALFYTDGTANGLTRFISSAGSPVTSVASLFAFTGDISPTALAGATDDWAPTGLATASVIRVTLTGGQNLTGLTGGADGRIMFVLNVDTADTLTLKHDTTSSASNRFFLPGATDLALTPNSGAFLMYDSTSSRWRVIGGTGSGGGGVTTFVALTDAFASFSSKARQFVRVNAGETALEPYEIAYTIPMFVPGAMTNAQLVYQFIAVEDIRIPSGASGSQAKSGVASTGNVHFDIKKNGADVGDVVFNVSTAGSFTVGSDIDLTAGDLFQLVGPATADATLADVSISFKAKRMN